MRPDAGTFGLFDIHSIDAHTSASNYETPSGQIHQRNRATMHSLGESGKTNDPSTAHPAGMG